MVEQFCPRRHFYTLFVVLLDFSIVFIILLRNCFLFLFCIWICALRISFLLLLIGTAEVLLGTLHLQFLHFGLRFQALGQWVPVLRFEAHCGIAYTLAHFSAENVTAVTPMDTFPYDLLVQVILRSEVLRRLVVYLQPLLTTPVARAVLVLFELRQLFRLAVVLLRTLRVMQHFLNLIQVDQSL